MSIYVCNLFQIKIDVLTLTFYRKFLVKNILIIMLNIDRVKYFTFFA